MGKRLIGAFNRKMTDEELTVMQGVCAEQKIRPVEDGKYDVFLWWLSATDESFSKLRPSIYEFEDGPNISPMFIPEAHLMAAFRLKRGDLERLGSMKERADGLRHMDRAILDIREETDVHRAKMKRLTGVAPSLVSKGAFRKFCDQLFTDRDHIYNAARRLFDERRYKIDVEAF